MEAIGKLFYVGEVGIGDVVKSVHNLIASVRMLVIAGVLVPGKKAGIELDRMMDVLLPGAHEIVCI